MPWRHIRVVKGRPFSQMQQTGIIVVTGILLRTMLPDPLTDLEKAHLGNVLLGRCNVDVVELFPVQESGLLKDAHSFESGAGR